MTHVLHVLIFVKIQVGAIVGYTKKHATSEIMCW
jgi:hypothetical protein